MTIMKQLIESMIIGYLEESYEDDLVESIFEEVSEETWEAIEEAILNELSPSLLARYSDKAREKEKKYRERERYFSDAQGSGKLDHIRGQKSDPTNRSDGQKKILSKYASLEKKYKDKADRREAGRKKAWDKTYNAWKDYREMPSDEFEKKHRMTKAEFKRKNS